MRSPIHRVVRAVFNTHTKRTIIVVTDGKREIPLSFTYKELEKFLRIKTELDAAIESPLSHATIEFSEKMTRWRLL